MSTAGRLTPTTLTRHRNADGPFLPLPVMDHQMKRQLVVEYLRATAGSGKSDAQVALDCSCRIEDCPCVQWIKSKLRSGSSLEEARDLADLGLSERPETWRLWPSSSRTTPDSPSRDSPRDVAALSIWLYGRTRFCDRPQQA